MVALLVFLWRRWRTLYAFSWPWNIHCCNHKASIEDWWWLQCRSQTSVAVTTKLSRRAMAFPKLLASQLAFLEELPLSCQADPAQERMTSPKDLFASSPSPVANVKLTSKVLQLWCRYSKLVSFAWTLNRFCEVSSKFKICLDAVIWGFLMLTDDSTQKNFLIAIFLPLLTSF